MIHGNSLLQISLCTLESVLAPLGRTRAIVNCCTPIFFPGEPLATAPGCREHSYTWHPTHSIWRSKYSSRRLQDRSPSTVPSHLLGRACSPTGAAASGMGDSTSLPTGFLTALEVQVCEGSARLQLDAEVEVAVACAARSW